MAALDNLTVLFQKEWTVMSKKYFFLILTCNSSLYTMDQLWFVECTSSFIENFIGPKSLTYLFLFTVIPFWKNIHTEYEKLVDMVNDAFKALVVDAPAWFKEVATSDDVIASLTGGKMSTVCVIVAT